MKDEMLSRRLQPTDGLDVNLKQGREIQPISSQNRTLHQTRPKNKNKRNGPNGSHTSQNQTEPYRLEHLGRGGQNPTDSTDQINHTEHILINPCFPFPPLSSFITLVRLKNNGGLIDCLDENE